VRTQGDAQGEYRLVVQESVRRAVQAAQAAGLTVEPGRRRANDRRDKPVENARMELSDARDVAAHCPDCPRCGNVMVWRSGGWFCAACSGYRSTAEIERRIGEFRAFPMSVSQHAVRAAPIFSPGEVHNSPSPRAVYEKWLDEVEVYTSPHRRRMQRRVMSRGRRAWVARDGSDLGGTESKWHADRARGYGDRVVNQRRCGAPSGVFVRADGTEVRCDYRCGSWRTCMRCLAVRKRKYQAAVADLREVALRSLRWEMSRKYSGEEGRWSEKLITFTVPHGESASEDARTLVRCVPAMIRKMKEHFRLDRGAERELVYVRALEVAPGGTGGHAHCHVWVISPFIDHAWVRVTWGRILRKCGVASPEKTWVEAVKSAVDARTEVHMRTRRGRGGREESSVPWPIADIRSASHGESANYATKVGVALYVAKGAKDLGKRIHPLHVAAICEALEGARVIQAARGWAALAKRPRQIGYFRVLSPSELSAAVNAGYWAASTRATA